MCPPPRPRQRCGMGTPNLGGASSSSTTTTSPSCTSSPTPVSSPLSSASSCCTTTTTSPLHEGLCSDVSGIDGLLESTSTSTLVAHLDMEGELDEDVDYEPDEVEVELDEVEEDEETGDVGARASENARDGADDRDDTVPDTDRDTGAGLRPILEDIPELTEREHVLAVHVSRLVVAELYHLLRSTGVVPGPGSTFRVDARITPARVLGRGGGLPPWRRHSGLPRPRNSPRSVAPYHRTSTLPAPPALWTSSGTSTTTMSGSTSSTTLSTSASSTSSSSISTLTWSPLVALFTPLLGSTCIMPWTACSIVVVLPWGVPGNGVCNNLSVSSTTSTTMSTTSVVGEHLSAGG